MQMKGWSNRGSYYRWHKKAQTSEYLCLEAHKVARALDPKRPGWHSWQWSRSGEKIADIQIEVVPDQLGVRLHYNYQKQPVAPYLVRWEITTPHYGGRRYWWLCPACGRRCADLYGGLHFACRKCHDLTYASAQEAGDCDQWITRRMYAIRRRLGDDGALLDPLSDKPPYMHWDTYMRLVIEYERLQVLMWGMLGIRLGVGLPDDLPDAELSGTEVSKAVDLLWADYQRDPAAPLGDLLGRMLVNRRDCESDPPDAHCRRPVRRTLGQTAKAAEIPVEFAREAQREGLVRPDAGRTTRRKRYRPKLASWLAKLHALRQAGLSWVELRSWTARRFLPEHEHERRWPAGYAPP